MGFKIILEAMPFGVDPETGKVGRSGFNKVMDLDKTDLRRKNFRKWVAAGRPKKWPFDQEGNPEPAPAPAPAAASEPSGSAPRPAPRPAPAPQPAFDPAAYMADIQARYDEQLQAIQQEIRAADEARSAQLAELTKQTEERKKKIKKPRNYARLSLLSGSELGIPDTTTLGG